VTDKPGILGNGRPAFATQKLSEGDTEKSFVTDGVWGVASCEGMGG
jgi:hypothetical protein